MEMFSLPDKSEKQHIKEARLPGEILKSTQT